MMLLHEDGADSNMARVGVDREGLVEVWMGQDRRRDLVALERRETIAVRWKAVCGQAERCCDKMARR